jgi:PAS domain S-box-containing protein
MSSADPREAIRSSMYQFHNWRLRYGSALLAVTAAALTRYLLGVLVDSTLPFILFYPTIMFVALFGGFGPGLFATLLSAASAEYFFIDPRYSFAVAHPRDIVGLVLFGVMGIAISAMGGLFRRRADRLQEFEKAVEGLEELIVVVDRDYRYVIANRAFLKYRSIRREDLIGRLISEILSAELFESTVKEKLDECFRGKIVQFEVRTAYPSLGERDISISYFPVEAAGGIERVACVLQDITERKEAERSLKLFRTLIDQSNDAVEVVDPETLRFLDVNEKCCNDLGYTREELLSMSVFDINPGLDEPKRVIVLSKLRESGSIVQEGIHRRKGGSTFPVETSLRLVQLERTYVVVFTRDISKRREAEAALRESEDRYRDLVEHSEDLVCTHDLDGRLLSLNPSPARILGYEAAELLQMPMRELLVREDRTIRRIFTTNQKDRGRPRRIARSDTRRRREDLGIQQHTPDGRRRVADRAWHGARHYRAQARAEGSAHFGAALPWAF